MRGAVVLLFVAAAHAATAQQPARPATADLQGVWNFATLTPLERPAQFTDKPSLTEAEAAAFVRDTLERNNRDRRDGGPEQDVGRAVNDAWFARGSGLARAIARPESRAYMSSLIVDPPNGRLPALTDAARSRAAADAADTRQHPADGPENRSLQERCLAFNAGPPILPGPYNNYLQILQFTDYVILFTEMIHDARIVPIGNAAGPRVALPRWLGEPRGRWEGDTLVIESMNFTSATAFRGTDEHLRLVERLRLVDRDTLQYEFTVDNPTAFTRPWTAVLPMARTTDRMFEYACHEGNHALPNILSGARQPER